MSIDIYKTEAKRNCCERDPCAAQETGYPLLVHIEELKSLAQESFLAVRLFILSVLGLPLCGDITSSGSELGTVKLSATAATATLDTFFFNFVLLFFPIQQLE